MKLTVVQRNRIHDLFWKCGSSGLIGLLFSTGIYLLVLRDHPGATVFSTLLLGTLTGIFLALSITLVDERLHKSGRQPLWFCSF